MSKVLGRRGGLLPSYWSGGKVSTTRPVQLLFLYFSSILSDVVPKAKCVLFSDVKVVFT